MKLQFVYITIGILTLLSNIALTAWLIRNGSRSRERGYTHGTEVINFRLPGKSRETAASTELLSRDDELRTDDTEIL